LVGQVQIRGNTLVTGGSEGLILVWLLEEIALIHRLAAQDGSVMTLQFDDSKAVSGGADCLVKVWDLKNG
jgi:F-box and WD-40 domain protein CDC4